MGAIERWEYRCWKKYGVCRGCGAADGSMHALGCERPGRTDVKVVPASLLAGVIEDAEEAFEDALATMDPETAQRFVIQPSYQRFKSRISKAGQ